ncbi:hypothetical protein [Actinomyces sp. 2119]|uniref:hypothetical protein n=1 Tax=Actinomyces sp. 2119 TaxID=2321393 RepID=UPI0011C43DAF|nr:hypothetical protein [Actinomyces sp. 2119]
MSRSTRHRESGQATVEYVGAVLIVVALLLAVVIAVSPAARQIGCELVSTVSRAVGGPELECGEASTEAEETHEPDGPCKLSESSRSRSVSVSVFATADGTGTITVVEMSDGTYQVSATNTANISIGEGKGTDYGLEVTVDGNTYGGGASAGIGAGLKGEATATYTVNSAEEAEQLRAYLQQAEEEQAVSAVSGVGGFLYSAYNYVTDRNGARSYTPPEPTSVTYAGGVTTSASTSATGGSTHVEAGVNQANMLGVTTSPGDGTTTVYYSAKVDGSVQGNNGVPGINQSEGEASGEQEAVVAVTFDKDGEPIETSMQLMYAGNAEASATNPFGDDWTTAPASGGRIYEATIDLTGPDAEQGWALARAVGAAGASSNPIGAHFALADYIAQARENGTVTAQDVETEGQTDFGLSANFKPGGIGFGFGYSDESSSTTYSNGRYLEGDEWLPWEGCE